MVLRLSEDSRMLYGDYLIRTKNPVLLTYLKEEEEKLARFIGIFPQRRFFGAGG